jgi:hypothetical protein
MLIRNKGSDTFELCWPVCAATLCLWFKALCVHLWPTMALCPLIAKYTSVVLCK